MRTIYKYPLPIQDEVKIKMPLSSRIIHVGLDPHGSPSIWAEVDPSIVGELEYDLAVKGTGHPVEGELHHLRSFVQGAFVWHVYIRIKF